MRYLSRILVVVEFGLVAACASHTVPPNRSVDPKVVQLYGRPGVASIESADSLQVRMEENPRFGQKAEIKSAGGKALVRIKEMLLAASSYRWSPEGEVSFCIADMRPDLTMVLSTSGSLTELGLSITCRELSFVRIPDEGGPPPLALWSGGVARITLADSLQGFVGLAMSLFPEAKRFGGFRRELTRGW